MQQNNSTSAEGSSITYDDTEEETEQIEQAASCDSQFDGTVGVFLFTSGVLYCFVGLAIICEGEFKDSVVEIARFLKLPPDVAGNYFLVWLHARLKKHFLMKLSNICRCDIDGSWNIFP